MKVKFFFRNTDCGFSIHTVFETIMKEIQSSVCVSSVNMPSASSMPWDVVKNSFFTYKNKNKSGVNHITGHIHDVIIGLIGCKIVLTVHDLVFIDNVKNPVKRFYKWFFWLYIPVRVADVVTCISAATKNNILKYIKTDKLVVIPNAIDPIYEYVPRPFNEIKPTILHIGTGWNKNLTNTIKALRGISCHLRIIGRLDEATSRILMQCEMEYSNAYDLTSEEIRQEYINCDMVNFPSIYEGFGMPIIEGQATGRVVLSSMIEPLSEVSGNAVHYVDPFDISSLRAGYEKIIGNPDYRQRLIQEGLDNVRRFAPEVIADKYLQVYKRIINK